MNKSNLFIMVEQSNLAERYRESDGRVVREDTKYTDRTSREEEDGHTAKESEGGRPRMVIGS